MKDNGMRVALICVGIMVAFVTLVFWLGRYH